jgi:hypothetical protein
MRILEQSRAVRVKTNDGVVKEYWRLGKEVWYEIMGSGMEMVMSPECEDLETAWINAELDKAIGNGQVIWHNGPDPKKEVYDRRWFAGMAMQGMMANPAVMEAVTASELVDGTAAERIAKVALRYADEMIKQLEK